MHRPELAGLQTPPPNAQPTLQPTAWFRFLCLMISNEHCRLVMKKSLGVAFVLQVSLCHQASISERGTSLCAETLLNDQRSSLQLPFASTRLVDNSHRGSWITSIW